MMGSVSTSSALQEKTKPQIVKDPWLALLEKPVKMKHNGTILRGQKVL